LAIDVSHRIWCPALSGKASSKLSSKSVPPPEHSSKSSPPPPEHSSKTEPPPPEHSSKSAPPPPPPPTSSPPGSSKSPDYGKGKGYYPPPPPGKGKGYYPPPEGKGKGYYPPPEGKGKGYYPPPVSSSKTPGKGKGYYPPPGKGKGYYPPPVPTCQVIPITFYLDDLRAGYNSTRVGTSFDTVPFYDSNNGEQLGFYSDESTLLNSGDCVGSGAFSFGSDPYTSQINFQFTCNGEFNTVTGGSGDYGCASGYEAPVSQDDLIIQSQLTLCGPLCPYTPPSE